MRTSLVGNAFLVGGSAEAISEVLAILEGEGIAVRGNPNVYVRAHARFGIDDARELRERASSRAVSGVPSEGARPGRASRYFIIATPTMTSEAQNALLKTLEESPAGAVFFLIVPAPQMLLATLRSRAQLLEVEHGDAESLVDTNAFLSAGPEQRIDLLKPLLEKDEDDKRDLRPIFSFFASLESKLAREPEGLRALYRARKFIGDKGALLKPLLEEVALLVPRV